MLVTSRQSPDHQSQQRRHEYARMTPWLTAEAEPLDRYLLFLHISPCAKLRGQPQITRKVVGLGRYEITRSPPDKRREEDQLVCHVTVDGRSPR
jgi:hypothetical protein